MSRVMRTVFIRALKKILLRLQLEESGQAIVEYILVLVVVVGIILGGLYQLNDAFRVFADNYFGQYLACLIETGELPTIGGGSAGECDQHFQSFSLANGRAMDGSNTIGNSKKSTGGEEGKTGKNGKNGKNDDESKDSSAAGASGNSGETAIAQGGGGSADGGSSYGSSRRFRANRGGRAAGRGENQNKSSTGSSAVTDLSGYQQGKAVSIPLRGAESINYRKRNEEKEKSVEKSSVRVADTNGSAKKDTKYIKVERRAANVAAESADQGFSFGYFLRYILIVAIIIAILFFIGGQLLQLSKSMD